MEKQNILFKTADTDSAAQKTSSKNIFTVRVDGASRGNPGPSGAGIYITGPDCVLRKCAFLGAKTNNQAEYLALALGLFFLHEHVKKNALHNLEVHIVSDSLLLIQQMRGAYKIRDAALRGLKGVIDEQLTFDAYTFTHVLRDDNVEADAQANRGVDQKVALPAPFVALLLKHEISI
jgi:ribonuclease HI